MRNSLAAIALAACVLAMLALAAGAQIPQKMNYQVMLTDDSDQPLVDQTVTMVFTIYDAESAGTALWTETQNPTTSSIGVVSVLLGDVTPIDIPFDAPRWLEVEVDSETLSPRRAITGAPYALTDESGGAGDGHSLDADDGDPVNALYVDGEGKVGIGTTTPDDALHVEGDARVHRELGDAHVRVLSGEPPAECARLSARASVGGKLELRHTDGALAVEAGVPPFGFAGGYLAIKRAGFMNDGLTVYGDYDSSGEPRVAITGTTSEIVFDLRESQTGRVQFPAGAIDAGEIWNEPGVASGQSATAVALTGGSTVNQINHSEIYCPGGGFVYVTATAQATVDMASFSQDSALFGVSEVHDAFSDHAQETRVYFDATEPDGHREVSVSVSGLFEVSNGNRTFYFLAQEQFGEWAVESRQLTTMYFPSSYGTVDTTD